MSEPSDDREPHPVSKEGRADEVGVELAAGGLVWSDDASEARLAVIHRPHHGDWVLPKGRLKRKESAEKAAAREAQEETGRCVRLGAFLGSYGYEKSGCPKVVLLWRMVDTGAPYETAAPKTEVDRVEWLDTTQAIERLTHESEKAFVTRICAGQASSSTSPDAGTSGKTPPLRIVVGLETARHHLDRLIASAPDGSDSSWAIAARRTLRDAADFASRGGKVDLERAWAALHEADRLMVSGMSDAELLARASSLSEESRDKLQNWRRAATEALFEAADLAGLRRRPPPLPPGEREALRHAVVESMRMLHEDGGNRYHRIHLVRRQLVRLVFIMAVLVLAAVAASFVPGARSTPFGLTSVLPVALAGALGGAVSAMYRLSRSGGRSRIPEALMDELITSGRPVVGAAAALFVHAVLHSGLIGLIGDRAESVIPSLVLGFIAGFSEQFVLGTVSRIAGKEEAEGREGR